MKAAASKRGFQAVADDGRTASRVTAAFQHQPLTASRNVVGIIPGAKKPGDIVIYSRPTGIINGAQEPPMRRVPDKIYNGAVDDGHGRVPGAELAEKFHGKPPQRSLVFAFWTLEEQGLLGSEYFGVNPLWPRNHIVGVINLDDGGPQPRSRDLQASGTGQSELEDVLRQALATQRRVLSPDSEPEKGLFFRSDHFSLAKQGIPAISPGGGHDLLVGGNAAGQKLADDYTGSSLSPTQRRMAGGLGPVGTGGRLSLYSAGMVAGQQRQVAQLLQGRANVPRPARQGYGAKDNG